MDDSPRHRRHPDPNDHAGLGVRGAAGRTGGIRISVGGGSADSGGIGNRGPGRDPRGRLGQQRAGLLRRAGSAGAGIGRRDRSSLDGAFRFHRKHRCDSGAAASLGADLPGERLGRNDRSVAAGDRGISLLYRRAVAGGALSGSLPAGFERGAGFVLDSFPVRQGLAAQNGSKFHRTPASAEKWVDGQLRARLVQGKPTGASSNRRLSPKRSPSGFLTSC